MNITRDAATGLHVISGYFDIPDDMSPDGAMNMEARYGEKAAYDMIHGRNDRFQMTILEGPYYCCVAETHLINPALQREGDLYGVSGDDFEGNVITRTLSRTQALCLLGRDKRNMCECNQRGDR